MTRKKSIPHLLEQRIRESLDQDYDALTFLDRLCALETAIRWTVASGEAPKLTRDESRRAYLEWLQRRVLELPADQRVALFRGQLPRSAIRG